MNDRILIHTPWEMPIDATVKHGRVAVINPAPTYLFRSEGGTYIAREPHVRVHFQTNRSRPGYEKGFASLADIRRNPAAVVSLRRARAMQRAIAALSPPDRAAMVHAVRQEIARRERLGLT